MWSVHPNAPDGRVRIAFGMSGMRNSGATRHPDGTALRHHVAAGAACPRDERAQRPRAAHARVDEGRARRRMQLLLGKVVADDTARQGRFEEFSHQPTLDDLALSGGGSLWKAAAVADA